MTANPQNGMTSGGLVLRALRRWGDRVAFSGHGGSVTYAQALDLVGRHQAAMTEAGAKRGDRLALLNANRADAWLAGMAAQALGLCATPLHPMGSADDQAFILEDAGIDFLLVDVDGHGERGGALSKGNNRLRRTFTLGPADYGLDLTAAAEAAGAVTAVDQAQPGDFAWLAYTGGTTGKSKGVLRRHASNVAVTTANLAEFEWPAESTFLAVAPISHVAGTKLAPILLRGGRVHLQNGFDPEAVLRTIAEQRISVALLVPTMIYLLLDHPKLGDTDLSSLDLLMYGTSPMSPGRLL